MFFGVDNLSPFVVSQQMLHRRRESFGELLQAASTIGDLRNCPVSYHSFYMSQCLTAAFHRQHRFHFSLVPSIKLLCLPEQMWAEDRDQTGPHELPRDRDYRLRVGLGPVRPDGGCYPIAGASSQPLCGEFLFMRQDLSFIFL